MEERLQGPPQPEAHASLFRRISAAVFGESA
jgi:hypothetical protein